MSSKTSEIDLHRSVADFLNWMLLPPAVWTTFPAGWTAMRTGAAGRLRACGLKAGMPDILVFHGGHTVGIELKTPLCGLSPAQIDMFNKLKLAGITVYIARSIDTVYSILVEHDIPLKKMSFIYGKTIEASKGRRPQKPAQGAAQA